MHEPPRQSDLSLLVPYVEARVRRIIDRMHERGFDAIAFETGRSPERQDWLYGIGRTHDLGRKPVTWTHSSKHIVGKAADIISKSRGWRWPEFYKALKQEANREGMRVLTKEQCHVEWRG